MRSKILLTLLILLLIGCRGDRRDADATPAPDLVTADAPDPTDTVAPDPTDTAVPEPTDTAVPQPTDTQVPIVEGDGLTLVSAENIPSLSPRIIAQSPTTTEELLLDGTLEIHFDQAMDQDAVASALQVVDENGDAVAGEISWPQARVMQFKPDRSLKPSTRYQVKVDEKAKSQEGESLLEGLSLDFYTIGPLSVTSIAPADGAEDIDIHSAVTVIFNRPVVPLKIQEEAAELPNPLIITPEIAGEGEWLNTSVYIFRPSENLLGKETYQVQVSAEIVNEISATGAQLEEDFFSSFSVIAPGIQVFSLVGERWGVRDNYQDLRLDQAFTVAFEQPMNHASTEAAISMTRPDGSAPVSFDFSWNELSTMVTFTPTQLLAMDTRYWLEVAESAESVTGGQLRHNLVWNAVTVPPPAIDSITPRNGTTQRQFEDQFRIHFTAPMDEDSLIGKVTFDPPIKNPDGTYDWWDHSLRFYGLEPSTTYNVTIAPGMSDPYGHEIVTGETHTFTTGPASPSVRLNVPRTGYYGNSLSLYRQGGPNNLWITHRNLDTMSVDLYHLTVARFASFLDGDQSPSRYVPPAEAFIRSHNPTLDAPLNTSSYEVFRIEDANSSPLAPGLYFVTVDSPQVPNYNNQRHDLTQSIAVANVNLTLKTTTTEALIWATNLNTGAPMANVPVTFYNKDIGVIFEATTDANGVVYRDDLSLDITYNDSYFAVVDRDGLFGMALSTWSDGVQPYDFGISTNYYEEPGQPTVYLYTDRPLYRPGQAVNFKGVVRLNDDLDYALPRGEVVDVTIRSYDEVIYEETLELNRFGTFSAEIPLADEAALGDYRIEVVYNGRNYGNGSFGVAEYRKPTFEVLVNSATDDVLQGDTIPVTVDAKFFSGGNVVNADVTWVVTTQDFTFTGDGTLRPYNFNVSNNYGYYYFYEPFIPSETIASGTGKTNASGELVLDIPAELVTESGSQNFTIEATVTDVGGNAVSGRTSVTVHQSDVYAGIRSTTYIGSVGSDIGFDLAAVTTTGERVPNQSLDFNVYSREWVSVQEEDDFGNTIWRSEVIETAVYTQSGILTDENGLTTATFAPSDGGSYRAVVTTRDANGNSASASTFIWVYSGSFIPWQRTNDHNFELIADNTEYKPGDTAQLLIASPFQGEATALVTVERGHIKQHEVIQLATNSTVYELPITGEMAPNVFVSVLIIKGVDANNPAPDFKVGMVQFGVDRDEQELNIELTPDREVLGPRDTVEFTVRVTDFAGNPVEAEVSLALADKAALSLAAPRELPILDHFYSNRWLGVQTALLLTRLMDNFNQELEDEIKGGGGGGGFAGVQIVREDFPDTALWEGHVTTDADGMATISVDLPDSLTTWVLDARAITLDTLVGQTTTEIQTTRPVLINPQTPRFFVVEDEAQVGATVHNNTDGVISADVTLQIEGAKLDSPQTQTISIPAKQQGIVYWNIKVDDVERVDAIFTVTSGEYNDASRPTLGTLEDNGIPVYKYEVPTTVGTAGQLLDGGAVVESLALPVFDGWMPSQGSVTVEVAPSLAAAMTEGLDYLEHYPYECTEQIVSKFLPNVLSVQAYESANLNVADLRANLETEVNIGFQKLYVRQLSDGGWPWWTGRNPRSDSLVTAWVVLALIEAEEAGYPVSEGVIDRGTSYLIRSNREVDGLTGRFKLNRQAFIEYVLAVSGARETSAASAINGLYDNRSSMDLYAQAYLAQAMALYDAEDPRIETITSDLISSAFLSATGASWEEANGRDYWNWNSDTRSTAIILNALTKLDPENPLVANAVRWLMAHRTEGRWHSTQDTAWVLMALTDWMVLSGELEADYQYEVALNGSLIGDGVANQDNLRETHEMEIDINDLFSDQLNRLAIGRNDGGGNLYYTTHMEVFVPVEGVQALDQGITISRAYFDPDDRDAPVTSAEQGDTLLARLTIVIPNTLHYVLIEDFLPAGLEAVDTSLLTSQQEAAPATYEGNDFWDRGYGWWYFDHVELRDEKVVISADYLPAGTYEYVYLVRASTVGEYRVIPPTAQEFYFPEVYGRGDGSLFIVTP